MSRRDIQGLRAVAVLAVILNHAHVPGFRGGYVGVDVFFVVSGFLITGLLVREAGGSGRVSLADFYARRARRILPAATLTLAVIVLVTAWSVSSTRATQIFGDAAWSAVFLANVHFADLGTDYFGATLAPSPVQHFWSLAVEEQFYLVWPALIAGLLALARRRGRAEQAMSLLPVLLGVAWVASLAWSVVLTRTSPTDAYFSSLTRAWELATGALLVFAVPALRRLPTAARHVLEISGMAMIAVSVATYSDSTPFPGWQAAVPVLGTAALLAAGVRGEPVGVGKLLVPRPMTWVGDLSYSLYLWHWPVLLLGAVLLTGEETRDLSLRHTLVLLAVTLVVSVASYHLVENPLRKSTRFRDRRSWALTLWPAAVGAVLLAVWVGNLRLDAIMDARVKEAAAYRAANPELTSGEGLSIEEQLQAALRAVDDQAPVPVPLPFLEESWRDLWQQKYRCTARNPDDTAEICPVGDTSSDRVMVVYGDSHAGQWLPALDQLAQDEGYRLIPLLKYGCTPFDIDLITPDRTRAFTECHDFRDWAVDQMRELDPEAVVVSSRALQAAIVVGPGESRKEKYRDGMAATLGLLGSVANQVMLIGDVSGLGFPPADCLSDLDSDLGDCVGTEKGKVRQGNEIAAEVTSRASVPYVDPADWVCVEGRCPTVASGMMVHADYDHLSMSWVKHIAPLLRSRLAPHL